MYRPFLKSMDSSNMERMFSTENKMTYFDETPFEEIAEDFAKLDPYIAKLPIREQELLYMHFVLRKKQTELGAIFKRTQAAISYRIKKAIRRIQFLMSLPEVDEEMIRKELSDIFDEEDLIIMCGMYLHTCQTQVAKDIGSNQCFVRHRYYKNIKILEKSAKEDPKYDKYVDLFGKIRDNTNILREVKLSRWDNGNYIVESSV